MTIDLGHHGDSEVRAGLIDLAVNVRHAPMPAWLAGPIAESLTRLSAYPDDADAIVAVARRHRRGHDEVSVRLDGADKIRLELRERGYAVRRGDTFPGLGADWLRIAVRDTATTDAFVETLATVIEERP